MITDNGLNIHISDYMLEEMRKRRFQHNKDTEPTEQSADDDIYEIGYEEASDTVQSASFETDETPDATKKPTSSSTSWW